MTLKYLIVFELHAGSLAKDMGIEIGGLVEVGEGRGEKSERERERAKTSFNKTCMLGYD